MEGTFAGELGEYSAGTYVRNPAGVGARTLERGCVLFVRLRQFHPEDRERVVVRTCWVQWFPCIIGGIAVLPLHGFGSERVSLVLGPRTPA